jgi:drug/metabolite transporter (DMT)-like permease
MRISYRFLFYLLMVIVMGASGFELIEPLTLKQYLGTFFLFEAGYIAGSFGREK